MVNGTIRINIDMDSNNNVQFYVNNQNVNIMDASSFITKINIPVGVDKIPKEFDILLKNVFYLTLSNNMFDVLEKVRYISTIRRNKKDYMIYN